MQNGISKVVWWIMGIISVLLVAGAMGWMSSVKADISSVRNSMEERREKTVDENSDRDKRITILETNYASIIKGIDNINTKLDKIK